MEPKHKEILRANRLYLCEQLVVDDTIIQYLYQEGILTDSQVEEIQCQSCNRKKTLMLLTVLPQRGPNAFSVFLRAVKQDFPWIAQILLPQAQEEEEKGTKDLSFSSGQWSAPSHLLQTVPSTQQLNRLAARLGSEWETVLLDLGLTPEDIYRCRTDHPYSSQSQVMAALVMWKQIQGRKATVQRLLNSLQYSEIHPSSLDQVFEATCNEQNTVTL